MAVLSKHIGSTTSPTATATPTPTDSPLTSLKVDVITDSDWDTGYCVHFQVTNTSNTDTKKWQLKFQIPQAKIYDRWNFNSVKQGSDYVVTPPDWAQVIPANQTSLASIGLCANKLGSDYKPTQVSAASL